MTRASSSGLLSPLATPLRDDGFAFVGAEVMRPVLEAFGLAEWESFAGTWNDLGVDLFMADGGRYRRRRFAAFSASSAGIVKKPHQPHYQSRDYNPLNGGVERWFQPITEATLAHRATRAVLRMCHALFDSLMPAALRPEAWHVEVHQFRIEMTGGQRGLPTPEGMHRDGVDWVFVMLVCRENIASGETMLEDVTHRSVGSFTLASPMDAALVDDDRMFHGVTPLGVVDPMRAAYRDVLVVTFRRA